MQSINRWLRKLVGEENEILFHFLRVVLALTVVAVLVALTIGILIVFDHAIPIVVAAVVKAIPYILAVAGLGLLAALIVLAGRRADARRLRQIGKEDARRKQAEEHHRARVARIYQSVLAADQGTRSKLEAVLASLRRFDYRLEVAIAPAHYSDFFGDNWANVREFVESYHGRRVPEVSAVFVEIILLLKEAQDIQWIPENLEQVQACWAEASNKRKWLTKVIEAAQAEPIASTRIVLDAEEPAKPKTLRIPEMSVTPPPVAPSNRGVAPRIPEMSVMPPPAAPSRKRDSALTPEMSVQPPPGPPIVERPQLARKNAGVGPAPKLGVPPSLEELQRYYEWITGNN